MIKVEILDDDLRELILYGVNTGKYKRIARDKKFVKKLTDIYDISGACLQIEGLQFPSLRATEAHILKFCQDIQQ